MQPTPHKRFRGDPTRFWMVLFMIVVLIVMIQFFCKEVLAEDVAVDEPPALATVDQLEAGVIYLLDRDGTPTMDPRRELTGDIARAVEIAARETHTDPWLLISMAYHESSFTPTACGLKKELGLLQVHGVALNRCKARGLNPGTNLEDSVRCGASWFSDMIATCGIEAQEWEQCRKTKQSPACNGALSAYLSGECRASTIVGPRVAARLRTRDKMMLHVLMPLR